MKQLLMTLGLLVASAAVAERELTLGEYAAEVRGRVVEKVGEENAVRKVVEHVVSQQ